MSGKMEKREIGGEGGKDIESGSSEPCSPTTSGSARPIHFVRRRLTTAEAKAEIRNRVVPIRFTPAELLWLKEVSRSVQVSVSEYVRRAAFGRKLPPPPVSSVNRETYQELSRIGNNLNQFVREVHMGKTTPVDPHMLQELRAMVTSIGLQVIGAAK